MGFKGAFLSEVGEKLASGDVLHEKIEKFRALGNAIEVDLR